MIGLRRHIEERHSIDRPGIARLLAVMALLVLGPGTPAALGSATSPGQLYSFGGNFYGQLGNANPTGNPNPTPAPVSLPGEVGPVTQAAGGAGFSLLVTSSGQLYTFGRNYFGQLGNEGNIGNPLAANPTPTLLALPGATGPVSQVAAGQGHSLAVTATGQLYAFGYNWFGQLGDATNNRTEEANPTPALVTLPGATGPVTEVAAGGFHSLALTSTGQLYAFGDNDVGQLGTATKSSNGANPTPTRVTLPGATGPVARIAAGEFFSLAVTSTGQLYAFGENDFGQLGNTINTGNPLAANPTPTLVALPDATGPVTEVAAGNTHSLALTSTGQLYGFGDNRVGELGSTTNNQTEHPNPTPTLVRLPGASGLVVGIAAGEASSLALTSAGALYAFGLDYSGQLGTPPGKERGAPHPTPTPVVLPGGASIEMMASGPWSDHTFVVSRLGVDDSLVPGGELGVTYRGPVAGVGGGTPYTWSASGLPPGLSIDPTSGVIAGTPTATGAYTPTITLTDNYGIETSTQLTITIDPPPAIQSEALAAGERGVPYSASVGGVGGDTPYTWSASGLPPGLSIDPTSGVIAGTPTATGAYTATITLTDNYGVETSTQLTITIDPPPATSTETLPPATPVQTFPSSLPNTTAPTPSVQHARQSARRWRESSQLARISRARTPTGTTISFSLDEQATVAFSFIQIPGGFQGAHSCLARTHRGVRRKSCNTIPAGTFTFVGHSGTNDVFFAGRISRTNELKSGQYELLITAITAGRRSRPVALRFTIVR